MRTLILIAVFFNGVFLLAGNKQLEILKSSRDKAIARERAKFDKAVEQINALYIKKLTMLKVALMKKGDLDGAWATKKEIDSLTSSPAAKDEESAEPISPGIPESPDSPSNPGKSSPTSTGDKRIVIWNTHNFFYRDRGAEKLEVQLLSKRRIVWKRKTDIPWDSKKCQSVTLTVPKKIKFDKVKVIVTQCHDRSAGLTEVQVLEKGKNIALGKYVRSSAKYGRPGHGGEVSPFNITDGITEDASKHGAGYWLVEDKTGWVEIDMRRKARRK